jgi:hypothetical protein
MHKEKMSLLCLLWQKTTLHNPNLRLPELPPAVYNPDRNAATVAQSAEQSLRK